MDDGDAKTQNGCETRDTIDRRPARPLKVIVDEHGCPWLCDAGVNPTGDLAAQGCWRCHQMPGADDEPEPPEGSR